MCIFIILMNCVFLFSAFTAFSFPLTLLTSLFLFGRGGREKKSHVLIDVADIIMRHGF